MAGTHLTRFPGNPSATTEFAEGVVTDSTHATSINRPEAEGGLGSAEQPGLSLEDATAATGDTWALARNEVVSTSSATSVRTHRYGPSAVGNYARDFAASEWRDPRGTGTASAGATGHLLRVAHTLAGFQESTVLGSQLVPYEPVST